MNTSGSRLDHHLQRAVLAQEVRRQHLDRRLRRARADGADHRGEMPGAAVGEVVAVDRGDDDVRRGPAWRPPAATRLRLAAIERLRQAVLTLQKAQARVQVSPMIMKVACFFSQHSPMLGQPASSQTVTRPLLAHDAARLGECRGARRLDADPVRLAQHGLIGPMRLFRMPGTDVPVQQVDEDRHDTDLGLRGRVGNALRC